MKIISIMLILCIIVAILAARIYFSQQPKKVPSINYADLHLPNKPNYCFFYGNTTGKQKRPAVVFDMSKTQLMDKWQKVITNTPRIKLVNQTNDSFAYVIHSAVFAFPDIAYVQFHSLETNKTKLWIYSHAVYGHSDFGVNCKRANKWISRLHSE